ncbi:MAG: triose-phosphate isomerase [Lewinellaceae bacterium]|nr:triose-phosphate isomerase [Lewinellaceae bacterium]
MKRQRIVAGNWKMNKTFDEGRDLAISIIQQLGPSENLAVLCPPFIHLNYLSVLTNGIANLKLGAQNCHFEESGAFTGEISAAMLKSVEAEFVILGHSERREYFKEAGELLAKKVDSTLKHGLRPIFCCGEKLDAREAGNQEEIVKQQLEEGLFHLEESQFSNVVIAYEPVWAIGTGKTASPEQAQEMHRYIRNLISLKYSSHTANLTTILYGGSCNPKNAKELFSQPDVDGGLIGGASLHATDFISIFNSFPVSG